MKKQPATTTLTGKEFLRLVPVIVTFAFIYTMTCFITYIGTVATAPGPPTVVRIILLIFLIYVATAYALSTDKNRRKLFVANRLPYPRAVWLFLVGAVCGLALLYLFGDLVASVKDSAGNAYPPLTFVKKALLLLTYIALSPAIYGMNGIFFYPKIYYLHAKSDDEGRKKTHEELVREAEERSKALYPEQNSRSNP